MITYISVMAASRLSSAGRVPVRTLPSRFLPNIQPRQHHVWWELGGR